jgi:hypothetical protein
MLFPRNIGGAVTSGYWFILRFFPSVLNAPSFFSKIYTTCRKQFFKGTLYSQNTAYDLFYYTIQLIFFYMYFDFQVKFYFPKFSWKKVIWYILKPKILNYKWLTTSHNNQK